MNYINENLTTPIRGEYDVIVVGGGNAGSIAGIAAARAGAKTLVVERQLSLGGMWTGGFVNPVFDFLGKEGILAELVEDHKRLSSWGGFMESCFGYENMKRLLEEKLTAAGGEVLFETEFSRALVEDGRVIGIVVENREGRAAYMAKVVIDCSGDAQVVASAGLDCHVGRESDGLCQAMTLMFTIGNVNFMQETCDDLRHLIEEALKIDDNGYRLPYTRPYVIQIPSSRTAVVQLTHMRGYSPLSQSDLSKAAIEGRKQAYEVVEFMKNRISCFQGIELLQTAPLLGIRESRRIIGEYTLTKEDAVEGHRFDDEVTSTGFSGDIHDPVGDHQSGYFVKRYGIPYRCLIPKGIEGLLVAGKTISGTSEAMSSFRVTSNCAAMGEAAGKAAADAALRSVGVREASFR